MKVKRALIACKRLFVKRKYKDILFRYVFRDKSDILQLYNAINQTNYTNAEELVVTTMEDVIYIGMKNDLSFLIANELNLYEHQSTMNQNMPLRGLLYFAKMYEGYVESQKKNRFQKERIPLPYPRYIVFYNGEENLPQKMEMRLSESFEERDEEPAVECIARFININYGQNDEILKACKRLQDYSYFVSCVRKYLVNCHKQDVAIKCAIDECIQKGVLEDVLLKHRAEVEDMFLTTFDKKMYEEALRLDAISAGRREGLEKGRTMQLQEQIQKKLQKGCSIQEIADALEEELEVIEKIIKEL